MVDQAQSRYQIRVEVIGEQELLDFQKAADKMGASIRQINGQTSTFSRAAANTNSSLSKLGYQASQTGLQIGDFVSQVTGGIDPLRAFGQQAAQLAGLFRNPWVAVGVTAAAIGATLIPAIRDYFKETKTAEEITDGLASALSDLESALSAASLSADELTEKYGDMADAAQLLLLSQVDLQRIRLQDFIADNADQIDDLASAYVQAGAAGRNLRPILQRLASDFSLTASEAQAVRTAMTEWIADLRSGDIDRAATANTRLLETFHDLGVPMEDLPRDLREIISELNKFGLTALAVAPKVDEATNAVNRMNTAAADFRLPDFSSPLFDIEDWLPPQPEVEVEVPVKVNPKLVGAVGVSEFQQQVDSFVQSLTAYETPAEAIHRQIDQLIADWQRYGDSVEDAQRAEELYYRGLDQLNAKLIELETEMQELGPVGDMIAGAFTDMFSAIADGSKTAGDAFSDMLDRLLKEMADFLISQAVQQFMQVLLQMATAGASAGFSATPTLTPTTTLSDSPIATFRSAPAVPQRLGLARVMPQRSIPMASSMGQGSGTTVNVYNNADVSVREEKSGDGKTVDLYIEGKMKSLLGSGALDRTMRANYGLRRSG
ncbi:hypothetical protein [Alloyangia pacifica]|uniref:Uncharacterized protein n=1 Tax=Alloyangia pacifica TaxID=311180 RepID=A0A1I6PN82_9RHOB|nr:hypothetical protein [Alloyangia pacifica]SDG31949.1 hypothetical protein SAMN04488245_102357 [Alloyangia pacifica]SFS41636.1 hypothetical protein SAMN04488050_101658 [Alloyangia pacifica]